MQQTGGECQSRTICTAILEGYTRNFRETQLSQTCREDTHHAQLKHGRRVQSLREPPGPRASSRLPIQLAVLSNCLPPLTHFHTGSAKHTRDVVLRSPYGYQPILTSIIDFRLYDCHQLLAILTHRDSHSFTHICIVLRHSPHFLLINPHKEVR
jgi:hypothetical protein